MLLPTLARDGARGAPQARTKTARRLAAAGLLSLGLAAVLAPAYAQRADQGQSVQTPFGRAPISFADIVEKVRPAVVSVSISAGARGRDFASGRGRQLFPDLPEDHPFFDFFRGNPRGRGGATPRTQSQGSGFVISADGYVVTNNHVVAGAGTVHVSFNENTKHEAQVIGTDPRSDLALLKIKGTGTYPFVRLAQKAPRVGDWVLAVGNPFGFGGTVTAGIVSSLGREVGSGPYDFMQIDAAVNKGNSGGPTFNLEGDVVGVNTAIYSPSGGNVGIAFAIPAKTVGDVINQLMKTGSVQRGWLGVKIKDLDPDTAASLGIQVPAGGKAQGAFIDEVTSGGPAERGGMKAQDVVIGLNGRAITKSSELARRVAEQQPGSNAAVEIIRDGRRQTLTIALGQFPSGNQTARVEPRNNRGGGREPSGVDVAALGLAVTPGRGGLRITEVFPNSDASDKGLRAGDVILDVGGAPVQTVQEIEASLKRVAELGRPAVMLRVRAGEAVRNVPIRLGAASRGERREAPRGGRRDDRDNGRNDQGDDDDNRRNYERRNRE